MDVRPSQHLNLSCPLLHKDFATALPLKFVQLLEVSSPPDSPRLHPHPRWVKIQPAQTVCCINPVNQPPDSCRSINQPAKVGVGPPVRHIRELGNGVDRQALMARDSIQYFATVSPSHSIWTTDGLHAR